jgi:hypothetical protein
MRICEVSAAGYRSLRAIRFPVGGLTVFAGAYGETWIEGLRLGGDFEQDEDVAS